MKLFHALAVVGASAPQCPGRGRLRAALAARSEAQHAVIEARAILERLESVIEQADDAARTASAAAVQAKEARQRWVRDGCLANAREHQVLSEDAAKAASVAQSAALDADAVSKELLRAQSAVQSAQVEVGHRDQEIAGAVGEILVMEQAPLLESLERAASEFRDLRFKAMALLRAVQPGRYEDQRAASYDGARLVGATLERASIKSWDAERDAAQSHDFVEGARGRDEKQLEELVAHWRTRAALLQSGDEQ